MPDLDFARKIDAVHKFAVRENKATTYALDKATINSCLKLCALVAKAQGGDECGECQGCLLVADLHRVLTGELRKYLS